MGVLSLRSRCEAAEAAGRDGDTSPLLVSEITAEIARVLDAPEPDEHTALVWSAISSGDPADTGVEATAAGRAWQLSGRVLAVHAPSDVRTLLVVSRSRPLGGRDRGIRVHRVAADAPGVRLDSATLVDGTPVHTVHLDGVEADDSNAVGPPRDATPALSAILDTALVLATAEMLGAASAAQAAATEWVKQRVQFGAPLSSRQVVQHRIAEMEIACTAVRALVDDAVARAEAGEPFGTEAAVAKLVAGQRLPDVTAAAHQLHGGEGYYADRPLHRWHKRVLVLSALLGGPAAQRARLAAVFAPPPPRPGD